MSTLIGRCLCGAVTVTLPAPPDYINDCNCSLCRRSGGAWGYCDADQVSVTGKIASFVRSDISDPAVELKFCPTCGTTTHWVTTPGFKAQNPSVNRMGVNMKLFDPASLYDVEVRFPDGAAWSETTDLTYRRAPMIISEAAPW